MNNEMVKCGIVNDCINDSLVYYSKLEKHRKKIIQNILFSNTMSEPYSLNSPVDNSLSLRDTEKSAILTALDNTKGNLSKAAKLLKIGRTTLYRKMQEFGLSN